MVSEKRVDFARRSDRDNCMDAKGFLHSWPLFSSRLESSAADHRSLYNGRLDGDVTLIWKG